jgi:deazaflavin-dependent oxidoreductase (nitroreductase family)
VTSDLTFKVLNRAHRFVLKATGGRLGWNAPVLRMPVVELTTIGRKSGQPRRTMLTSPLQEGSTIVLVASASGNDRHPAWFLNIQSNPEVTLSMAGKVAQAMTAEVADADERARLWPMITREHSNYAGYQRKTQREIPVVLVRPKGG